MSACSPRADTSMASAVRCAVLPRVVNGPGLPNHGHFDLAGIFQRVLAAPGDVLREPDGLLVRDMIALDHDANLAAGLERKCLGHALEGIRDTFELFEAFHVRLEDVTTRAGTRRRDRVGRLHDHGLE